VDNNVSPRNRQSAIILLTGTVVAVVVVATLYWAQTIFIPVALAVFLTFLLNPLVTGLQRARLGRVPAVLIAMLVAVLFLGGMVWLVTAQVTSLVSRLPEYNKNIDTKLRIVKQRWQRVNRHLEYLLSPGVASPAEASGELPVPPPPSRVIVEPESPTWLSSLHAMMMPLAHGLGGSGLALVLTAFMLLRREDLRNRLIRLVGPSQVTVATRALDEAGKRMTRFLVTQALINFSAGLAIAVGLLVLGVEYALLWGFLVFALRYVPYIGIWFAGLPPVLLSFAMSQGWTQPLLVLALFFVVEMLCGNVLEPWLFGRSMGVSSVSLLVAAAFWAFLWGPIGMVLSSPMTVCLVVLGKYHPRLKFLDVLLGDEPVLVPEVRFYQRLLAHDEDEAVEIVQDHQTRSAPIKRFDEILVPALVFARHDRQNDNLSRDDEAFILQATREIGEELAERVESTPQHDLEAGRQTRVHVLGCPAHDEEDEVALRLLAATLDPSHWQIEVLSADTLGSEVVLQAGELQPDLICIAALPPGGLAHTRYLCKRLRARYPHVKILVARWGQEAGEPSTERLLHAGADFVAGSLEETSTHLHSWRPVFTAPQARAEMHREAEMAKV
jgi:predicted PurR-regulated permease PerM